MWTTQSTWLHQGRGTFGNPAVFKCGCAIDRVRVLAQVQCWYELHVWNRERCTWMPSAVI